MKTPDSIAVDRARPIGLWALSGVVLSMGCESLDTSGEVIHPIVDSLTTPPGEATVVLSRGGGRSGEGSTGPVATFRERFERREEVATIGDMEGTEEETFGLLWDAAITGAGEVLILDRIRTDVRVFSVTGDYLYTLGGQGEGPGELTSPCCLAFGPRPSSSTASRGGATASSTGTASGSKANPGMPAGRGMTWLSTGCVPAGGRTSSIEPLRTDGLSSALPSPTAMRRAWRTRCCPAGRWRAASMPEAGS